MIFPLKAIAQRSSFTQRVPLQCSSQNAGEPLLLRLRSKRDPRGQVAE